MNERGQRLKVDIIFKLIILIVYKYSCPCWSLSCEQTNRTILHVHIHTYTHSYKHNSTDIGECKHTHIHACIHAFAYMHSYMHAYTHTCIYTKCIHADCIHTYTCMLEYMHTDACGFFVHEGCIPIITLTTMWHTLHVSTKARTRT